MDFWGSNIKERSTYFYFPTLLSFQCFNFQLEQEGECGISSMERQKAMKNSEASCSLHNVLLAFFSHEK